MTELKDRNAETKTKKPVGTIDVEFGGVPCPRVPADKEPPDGGLWAWIVCFASCCTNGTIFGYINSSGVLYARLKEKFGDGDISYKISLVGSLCIGSTFLLSPVAAILTDKFGIQRTSFCGAVILTLGMLLSSFANSIETLILTNGLIVGVGASLAYTPSLVILGHYFKRRLGLVNGIVTAGSSAFTMVLPHIMSYCLAKFDIQITLRLLTVMMATLIGCVFTFRPLLKPPEPRKSHYSTINGHAPQGLMEKSRSSCQKCCTAFINTDIWRNKKYVVWAFAIPSALFGYFVPYVHLVKYVEDNFQSANGNILVTCIGATSGIGRIVFGWLADRNKINRIMLQQISFVSIGILTIVLAFARDYFLLVAICLGLGLFDGCFISLLGPIAFDIVGPSNASQAIGFLLGLCSLPLTVGPPIAGWLYDRTGHSYTIPFLSAGIPPIVGACVMFLINRVQTPSSPGKYGCVQSPKSEVCLLSPSEKLSEIIPSAQTKENGSAGMLLSVADFINSVVLDSYIESNRR